MTHNQTSMFMSDDLPLFSGTPMSAKEEPFLPERATRQADMFGPKVAFGEDDMSAKSKPLDLPNVIGGNLGLHVIKFPSGRYGYVGSVPVDIGFIDPTPEKIRAMRQCGAGFGPKQRVFDTEAEAIEFATAHGYEVKTR